LQLLLNLEVFFGCTGFLELVSDDQMALLKSSFMELTVLRLSYRFCITYFFVILRTVECVCYFVLCTANIPRWFIRPFLWLLQVGASKENLLDNDSRFYTTHMPFLLPDQQYQSTERNSAC